MEFTLSPGTLATSRTGGHTTGVLRGSPRHASPARSADKGRAENRHRTHAQARGTADTQRHSSAGLRLNPSQSQAALFATAVLWGSNPVCLRYLDLSGHPLSPEIVTTVQSAVAAVWLRVLDRQFWPSSASKTLHADSSSAAEDTAPLQADTWLPERARSDASTSASAHVRAWTSLQDSGQLAALELGCWMFVANAATVIGFQETSASRGAFLIRLTAVFTPFVALIAGQRPPPLVWAGSALAFVGGLLISLGQHGSQDGLTGVNTGDLIMAGAAVVWSCQTVRLGLLVAQHDVGRLSYRQMTVNALLCSLWFAYSQLTQTGTLLPSIDAQEWNDPWRFVALLWPAFGPWGLGTVLQLVGQQSISATRTQIILASDPVWATLFAGLLLGSSEQQLGVWGWVGAACILLASVSSRD